MNPIETWNLLAPFTLVLTVGVPLFYLLCIRKPAETFASATQRTAPASASRSDAIVLGILSIGTVLLTQMTEHVGGFFPRLNDLAPGREWLYWSALGLTFVLIGGGVFLAWRGKSRLAIGGLTLILCLYGAFFNSIGGWFQNMRSGWAVPEDAIYTIELTDASHEGAVLDGVDVWIAGEHLGKTPIVMSVAEFQELVPEEMARPEKGDLGRHAEALRDRPENERRNAWIRFQGVHLDGEGSDWVETYAQVALDGEPGISGGGSGGTGGGGEFSTRASVYFPKRDAKIEQLLDLARLNDYECGEALLDSLRSMGNSGLNAVRSKLETEPEFEEVLEQLLPAGPTVDGPDEAWAEFESILEKVDRAEEYSTDSEVGLRVAHLAQHLDPDKLANIAVKLARRPLFWGGSSITGAETFHVEAKFPRGVPSWFSPQYLPPRAFAIAHAIQKIEPKLGSPNVFEEKLTPELLRWQFRNDTALKAARAIGGEAYERFMERQDWRREWKLGDEGYFENRHDVGRGNYVNRWFWERLTRSGEEGSKFRKRHSSELFRIMDSQVEDYGESEPLLALLVEDCQAGDCELLESYWPRFKRVHSPLSSSDRPRIWFRYLARMGLEREEAERRFRATFAELARDPEENAPWIDRGFGELKFLPLETRLAVLRAMQNESLKIAETLDQNHGYRSYFSDSIPRNIERELCRLGDEAALEKMISEDPGRLARFANWLRDEAPDHELVAEFAGHADPQIRAIVPPIAAAHPTPRNRQLLAALADDDAPEVREAVAQAEEALAELRSAAPAGL